MIRLFLSTCIDLPIFSILMSAAIVYTNSSMLVAELPVISVGAFSTNTCLTTPSSTIAAYRCERWFPKNGVASKLIPAPLANCTTSAQGILSSIRDSRVLYLGLIICQEVDERNSIPAHLLLPGFNRELVLFQ